MKELGRMESARIARCSYRSLTVVIALSENSKYLDICNEICLRFKELKVGSFDLTYSLPDHPNCLLQSDMDLHMMLMCLTMLKISFVDILVKDLVSSNNDNGDQKWEESDHTASNHAMSNREVSNRTAPLSCTLESRSAIDENDHFGDSRLDGGNAYLSQYWKEYISHDGQRFEGGVTEFRNKLCKYAAHMRFRIAYVKNDKERVLAECFKKISDGCNWRIYACLCRGNGFFYIRSLNNVHTCTPVVDEQKSKMMSSKVVSSVLVDQIREKPTIKPADIVKDFKQKYGLDISYHSAWHGKVLAKSEVHGNESLSYNQLVQYRDALMSTNPGSHCVLECDPTTSRFQRLFICYGACIEGFRWCRPLLFIDATYFKSKYKGQLIGATGRDGNQGFFPFAFAILDSENEENWRWFFENLAKVLTPQGRTITFVSNHNRGATEDVSNIFPTSHHAFCLNDMKQNLSSKYPANFGKFFRDQIVELFMKCVYAPTEAAFEFNMKNLKDEGGAPMKTFLENFPKENWSYAYFKGNRYGDMCSTVSESFQSWISELYALPICQMVDGIRIKLMGLMSQRSCEAKECCSILCPVMEKTLNEMSIVGRHSNAIRSSASVFQVHAEGSFLVDLDKHFCSCHECQIKGFPCAHAVVAVQKNSGCIYEYIDDYFKLNYFRSSYATLISPIPDIKDAVHGCSDDIVILPPLTRQPGTKKMKSAGEFSRAVTCSRCGAVGRHNKKTCTANM
ncbi:hypothetical protein GBA52_020715 [Prunus armeniaca]|nr:hypothetical protein GBA52_020715 [Prunus armeniaca]